MEPNHHELAQRIRARAARTRSPHHRTRLLALARETEAIDFPRPPLALLAILRFEDALRYGRRGLLVAANDTRSHPPFLH